MGVREAYLYPPNPIVIPNCNPNLVLIIKRNLNFRFPPLEFYFYLYNSLFLSFSSIYLSQYIYSFWGLNLISSIFIVHCIHIVFTTCNHRREY